MPKWYTDNREEVDAIIARYPEKRSAIMPLMHLAQREKGYLDEEDFAYIGRLVGQTTAYVESVASFYVMYRRKPHGKYTVVVCEGLSCMLRGSERLAARLEERLGIKDGETTPDGLVTLERTHECLAACEGGPCLQVNYEYYMNVDDEKADRLVDALLEAGSREGDDAGQPIGDVSRLSLPPDPAPFPGGVSAARPMEEAKR